MEDCKCEIAYEGADEFICVHCCELYAAEHVADVFNSLQTEVQRLTEENERLTETAVGILSSGCEKHTGGDKPSWEEFSDKIKDRCHFCDVEKIAELENKSEFKEAIIADQALIAGLKSDIKELEQKLKAGTWIVTGKQK